MKNQNILCIIPARLKSTRLPEKVLKKAKGKTLLEWVYNAAKSCPFFSDVFIAYDESKIKSVAEKFTSNLIKTSVSCLNGTMRMIEAIKKEKLKADIYLNWQADEPLVSQSMISNLLKNTNPDIDIWTLKKKIVADADIMDPNVVKVITSKSGRALYFSRAPIPYRRGEKVTYYKHIGLYAYRDRAIEKMIGLPQSELEKSELLEQLTFMHNDMSIHVEETENEILGIDTMDDFQLFEKKFSKYAIRSKETASQ